MFSVLAELCAEDPRARERLGRLLQRSRLVAGTNVEAGTATSPSALPGMTFPGDALIFGGVLAFLTFCCHVSLVHLVSPSLLHSSWPVSVAIVVAATVAVITWKLGQLRIAPRTGIEALPDPRVDSPLVELHDFASAMRRALQDAAQEQRLLAHCLYGALLGVGIWGFVLLSKGYTRFGELLMMAAALTASFLTLNWRPYTSANRRARLAEGARQLAYALTEEIRRLNGNTLREWTLVREAVTGALEATTAPPKGRWRWRSRERKKPRA
jgi:hypothetical protein